MRKKGELKSVKETISKAGRILCLILAIAIPEIAFVITPAKVYASEISYKKEKEAYYAENPLKYYLDKEKNNNTGVMNKSLEEVLNLQGVFDDDIVNLSQEDITVLEKSEHIQVYNQYVEYTPITENIDSKELPKNDGVQYENNDFVEKINEIEVEGYDSRVLSKTEIDELIEEIYFTDEKIKEENIFEGILTSLGLKPVTVYGADDTDNTDVKQSSYLRKTLIVSESTNTVHIIFIGCWITEPSNRLLDMINIAWIGGKKYDGANCYARLTYKETYIVKGIGMNSEKETTITEDYSSYLKENWTDYLENGIYKGIAGVAFKLPESIIDYGHFTGYKSGKICSDISMMISISLKKSGSSLSVKADYLHQKEDVSVDELGGVILVADVVTFCVTKGKTTATSILEGIKVLVGGINLLETDRYYETAGGKACSVNIIYK